MASNDKSNSTGFASKQHGLHNIPSDAKWSADEDVIMEGLSDNVYGFDIDQENGSIFVADALNDRIISWTPGEQGIREVVIDLSRPSSVLIDKENNSLIIADCGNERVIRWSLQAGNTQIETIIDNIACYGLAIDKEGSLYVSVVKNEIQEVRRYAEGKKTGEIIAGGNGQGDGLHQLNGPIYIVVDNEGAVYVSDYFNHRVVKWNRGAKEGILVAGFEGHGSKNTQLDYPRSILLDANSNLYIVEQCNHRVVRYQKNGTTSDVVIERIIYPLAAALDNKNHLYISVSNRLLRFKIVN